MRESLIGKHLVSKTSVRGSNPCSRANKLKGNVMKVYFDLYKRPPKDLIFTKQFLKRCKEVGYNKISIGTSTKEIRDSTLSFFNGPNHVFAAPNARIDGWPAIWRVAEEFKVISGAGNSHQHQLKHNNKLVLGYYKLINNKWEKLR